MCSKPEKIQIFSIIPCWVWVFVLFPMYMPFLLLGLWAEVEISVWLEIGYHVFNGIALLLLMLSYLKEEWFMVTTDVSYYLKHIALTVGLIIAVELVLLGGLYFLGFNIADMLDCLPVVEAFVTTTPCLTINLEPVFGTIALSIFAPISICVLFYCFGFAPVCYNKPWLAYLCVAAITLIPPIINIIWRGQVMLMLSGYLVQLPIHLLACWSYQKTDNVWTPIISLSIVNFLTAIVLQIMINI